MSLTIQIYKKNLDVIQVSAGKRNRTPDLRVTNAVLYQLSYSGFDTIYSRLIILLYTSIYEYFPE